ncbi:hypothetical protein [Mycolicibacterium sp. J2]|uniref:hypothetical protein n=1 Tax=Mycolicibacterium sp. J2 TaxID=2993511 RepID=UPI00224B3EDD|nr:hypothetical protein [Mycolicibacterium sp. J2]MCX2715357.1 hypothetical protein [Mycolicibacterium sp. J2]
MTDDVLAGTASLADIAAAFRAARDPDIAMLSGRHRATLLGPAWLRLTGMPNWYGKSFQSSSHDGILDGVNLLRRNGEIQESIPMTAFVEVSPYDDRPALVVRYPASARLPWRNATDHLRPLGYDVLLGRTFGIPATPRGGAPFLLRRIAGQP